MIRAYDLLINANKDDINGETFNAGWENKTVNQIAEDVKEVIGKDVKIKKKVTDDNRSYHMSSKKIKNILNFKTNHTNKDAVRSLKKAFETKLLFNTFENDLYYNIKRMTNINLK